MTRHSHGQVDWGVIWGDMGIQMYVTFGHPWDTIQSFETDTMIRVEIGEPSLKRTLFDLNLNNESLTSNLPDKAWIRNESYKVRTSQRYNTKIKSRSFHKGDLVWKMCSEARENWGKFSSNSKGPFHVIEEGKNEAYQLKHLLRNRSLGNGTSCI